MKKTIVLLISALLVACIFSSGVSAEEVKLPAGSETQKAVPEKAAIVKQIPLLGKDALDKVINIVRNRIDIPSDYVQFNSDVYDNAGSTMFRLRWSNDYSYAAEGGSLEVTVDGDGTITNYNHYTYNRENDNQRRLPAITEQQAFDSAVKFIGSLSPDLVGQLVFVKSGENSSIQYDGSYSFGFSRQYKDIPFYDNNVTVQVNGQTGEIMSLNRVWNDSLVFPDASKVIGNDTAKAAYMKQIKLELGYREVFVDNNASTYLQYAPAVSETMDGIDAFTGSKVTVAGNYSPYYSSGYRPDIYNSGMVLSQVDIKELQQLQDLISVESAEKLARSMADLGLDGTYRLSSYSYSKYSGNDDYTLQLNFISQPVKENFGKDIPEEKLKVMLAAGEGGGSSNVVFNAKTSELISFSSYGGSAGSGTDKSSLTRDAMQRTVEDFLKKYKAEKFNRIKLSDSAAGNNEYMMKYGKTGPQTINAFNYIRTANGIPFDSNSINISIDMNTGKIASYSETWDTVEFKPAVGLISTTEAYVRLFEQNALKLRYVTVSKPAEQDKAQNMPTPDAAGEIRLVYAPDPVKPLCLDAKTGILLNNQNGEAYKEKTEQRFIDMENHPARLQVEALGKAGMIQAEDNFRPDEVILQKDFMYMLFKLRGDYMPNMSESALSQTEQDGMYRILINNGVLEEAEKAPDNPVAKEEAVKYLLRSVGYKKFAEMDGIFICDFSDKADINPQLLGYAAISKALKLVAGTAFEPEKRITRAEAALLVYNYLKRP